MTHETLDDLSLHQQGYQDGLAGTERARPDSEEYRLGYSGGVSKREYDQMLKDVARVGRQHRGEE